MKLFVDDIREAPDESWTLVNTISSAVNFIERYYTQVKVISLDHDISYCAKGSVHPSPDTFMVVAKFIYLNYELTGARVPKIIIHTSNPDGAKGMASVLEEACDELVISPFKRAKRICT